MLSVSKAVIARLPRYYRYICDLEVQGVSKVSSSELAQIMNVTSSQIRQDFNYFGGFGKQGYGYDIKVLKKEIARLLGLNNTYNVLIVGGGNVGRAYVGVSSIKNYGFNFKGIVDIDPQIVGTKINNVPVIEPSQIETFVKDNDIKIGIIVVPKENAKQLAHKLYDAGVRAFINFAHADLNLPVDAYIKNIHFSDSLLELAYSLSNNNWNY